MRNQSRSNDELRSIRKTEFISRGTVFFFRTVPTGPHSPYLITVLPTQRRIVNKSMLLFFSNAAPSSSIPSHRKQSVTAEFKWPNRWLEWKIPRSVAVLMRITWSIFVRIRESFFHSIFTLFEEILFLLMKPSALSTNFPVFQTERRAIFASKLQRVLIVKNNSHKNGNRIKVLWRLFIFVNLISNDNVFFALSFE